MKPIWCNVFQRCMLDWRRGWGQSDMDICTFCYILNLFGTKVFHRSMVDWRKGWGLSALVSVHTSTCETSSVKWSSRDL